MPAKAKEIQDEASARWAMEDHGLDFTDPRIIAAMKVTGIKPSELELEPAPDVETASEKEIRRHEVKERKCISLIEELKETAESLDTRDIDALITGPGIVDERGFFLEEKAKIDQQRQRAREEIQRKAKFKVDTTQALARYNRDYAGMTKRVEEQKAEKAAKNQALMEAKKLKVEANIKAARAKQAAERKRIMQKLQETDDRVSKNLEDLLRERNANIGRVQEKAEENARNLERHMDAEMDAKLRKTYNITARTQALEGWIDRRDRDQYHRAMEGKAHLINKREFVENKQAEELQERDKAAKAHLERINKARQQAADNFKEVSEKAKEDRSKRLAKWSENHLKNRVDRRKKMQQLQTTLNTSAERSGQIIKDYQEATIGRYTGIREIFNELVAENQERLARSDDTTRSFRLGKIAFHKAQGESREDQKRQATEYRVEAFRERVAGHTQVEELQDLLNLSMHRATPSSRSGARSAQSQIGNRMHAILNDLGVPIPTAMDVAEGEAGTANPGESQGK